jgi:hypothetical protein
MQVPRKSVDIALTSKLNFYTTSFGKLSHTF